MSGASRGRSLKLTGGQGIRDRPSVPYTFLYSRVTGEAPDLLTKSFDAGPVLPARSFQIENTAARVL